MKNSVYSYNSDSCQVSYLEDKDAILCTWKQFCQADEYKNPLLYGLKILNETQCKTWITDTQNGFESTLEDTQWLLEEFLPKTIGSSCKNIIFIIKNDSPLNDEIAQQAEALGQYFDVKIFETLDQTHK